MSFIKTISVLVFISFIYTSPAQINMGGKIKQAGKKLENKVEEKTEKKIDDKIDDIIGSEPNNTISASQSVGSEALRDEHYKGPAKNAVKGFWNQIELLKGGKGKNTQINNAEKFLKDIKEKDPAYNTAGMEVELNKYRVSSKTETPSSSKSNSESKNTATEQTINEGKVNTSGYAGPASGKVTHFWKYASKPTDNVTEGELSSRIYEMEYALKGTKEKDPGYNTSEMEIELNKLKDRKKQVKMADANAYHGDKTQAIPEKPISGNPDELFEDLFENESLQLGSSSQLSKAPAKIEVYKAKTNKLLAMDYANAKIEHTGRSMGSINGLKRSTDKEIAKIDEQLSKFRNKEAMEYSYYNMQLHLAFWDAAQKVFSEEASYKEMYLKVAAAANKLGSLESMTAKAESNNTEYIKSTNLPNAVVKDPALEKVLMDGFNKQFGAQYKVSALKAVLTQDGWTILRNSLTSVIIGRERSAKIAYKGSDGKCYVIIDYVFIHEDYDGASYKNTKAVYTGLDGKEMLCENVK